ncbi:MAG: thioredoxin-disulfide reductase [Acidobacteria bacterium]|uniref:Thioredoxin reductase n=1 Tax=Candidatus Polarisedimenticola svalbardensis TaxID=2886004 RepID=A0A8J7C1F3_9BACT|nr:thioredoxin-disulfide reductase [Candidatus Polarisedimenticola svalbardensis]
MAEITVYSRDWCPYCRRACALLDGKGVEYNRIDLDAEPERMEEMIRLSGGMTTVPQIFIGDRHIGGSDDLLALDNAGELDELLESGQEQQRGDGMADVHQVVIIGSGPAGLTAAIYSARANLKPVVVEGLGAGGQLMNTTDVENYPGFPEGIMGPDMMEKFKAQAERFGTTFVSGDATAIDFSKRPFTVSTEAGDLMAETVIVATGASPLKLGVKGEEKYSGRGVSYCATCDGFFFRDKEIVVVGGGDTAMEEALFLTRFGTRVTVIHRRDEFRASKIMADRVLANEKIVVLWDSVVEEVTGDDMKVTAIRVKNVKTGEVAERPCSGFFVGIGHSPNSELFRDKMPEEDGYLKVHGNTSRTDVDGVFVAGDVHDHVYRQAVTAAGEGCKAAIDCERWLEAQNS